MQKVLIELRKEHQDNTYGTRNVLSLQTVTHSLILQLFYNKRINLFLYLLNLQAYVNKVQLLYKLNILLAWKHLRYAVSQHLVYRSLLYVEAAFFHLLSDPALVDINVFKLRTKLILLFCNYSYYLLIITLNNRRLIKL